MGTFTVKFTVSHPLSADQRMELDGLVDTGALFTQIPADMLSQIGIAPSGSRAVHYADGTRDIVPVAKADVAIDGVETATMILCGRPRSLVLLGATTLETLGLGVDPIHKKLITIEAPMATGLGKTSWRREAIRHIRASRRSTLAFLMRVPAREILRPRTQDRWSVKDVLAHLLGGDEETVRRFELIARGHAERIRWFDMAYANRFNARSVARARPLGLPALLRRMERARADLIESLERLPPEALSDPSHAYTVVDWLPTSGWNHELRHLSELKAWWRVERTARAGRGPARRSAVKSKRR